MVEVAESWGLFWGGYGFRSGGCTSPEDWSSSVRRDPHHFEFRGTAEMALAIARHRQAPTPPMSCFDTVGRHEATVLACNTIGVPSARSRTRLPIDPPSGTTAVVVTATATGGTAPGYLTVEPCSVELDAVRSTSNTNFGVGDASANTAIVAIGRDDDLCVWRSAPVDTIVDVVGDVARFDRSPDAKRFSPVAPTRAADTRATGHCPPGAGCQPGPAPAGSLHEYVLGGSNGILADAGVDSGIVSGVDAVVNVAAVDAATAGFVSADRCSRLASGQPTTSTVNHLAATPRANMTFVSTDDTSACLFTSSTADLIVDVAGVLGTSGLAVTPVAANRVLDTRSCTGPCGPVAAGSTTRVVDALPADGAVVNVTVTEPLASGFASVQSCASLAGGHVPTTSTVNFAAGSTVANMAFVATGETDLCVYSSAPAHFVVDVQATLSETGPAGLVLVGPVRAVDTRK